MMNSSGKTLTVLIGGVVIVTLLAFLALSGVAATFAWMAGGGYGSGPALCQSVHTWDEYLHACHDTHTWWKHLSLRASEPDRRAGRGLGASDGQCAVRESQPVEGASAIQTATSPGTRRPVAVLHLARPPSRRR